jgi:uncharacterized NAD(P)/FAD-binding protein YdhS
MAAIEEGRLKITRGGVTRLESRGTQIRVHLNGGESSNRHHERAPAHLDGALVINCTGPQTHFSATRSPLLRNLLASGFLQPDALDMGIRIEDDFVAVGRDGHASGFLHVIGPLLRGTLWETVAVPELRGQALRVAEILLDELSLRHENAWATAQEPEVIEYWI